MSSPSKSPSKRPAEDTEEAAPKQQKVEAAAPSTKIGVHPYLTANGNGREMVEFYRQVFDAEIDRIMTYADAPGPMTAEDWKDKIMHASIKFGDSVIMISDCRNKDKPASTNGNIAMSLDIPNVEVAQATFDKLAEGGTVTMPFSKPFWGGMFGMVKDKFETNWMVNCHDQ